MNSELETALHQVRGSEVLVVEDSSINQQVLFALLHDIGLLVSIAENGLEAVKQVKSQHFDLVLMDIQMPVMDGFEATRQIRAQFTAEELPILAMTAGGADSKADECLAVGMNDHILKSLNPEILYQALIKWLRPVSQTNAQVEPSVVEAPQRSQSDVDELFPDQLPGLDLTRALQNVGGNKGLLLTVFKDFYQDHRGDADKICEALVNQDYSLAQRLAHTLNSTSALLGAMALHEAAKALELAIKQGEESQYLLLYAEIDSAMKPVNQVLKPLAEAVLQSSLEQVSDDATVLDSEQIQQALKNLLVLIHELSPDAVDIAADLLRQSPADCRDTAERLHDALSVFDFDTAENSVNRWLTQLAM